LKTVLPVAKAVMPTLASTTTAMTAATISRRP